MYPTLNLGSSLQIPTYFVIISLAVCLSLIWLRARTTAQGFEVSRTLDLSLAVLIFGFIGARLLHIVFEEPIYYRNDPIAIFKIWQGGFVYYGGVLFGITGGVLYYLKILKMPKNQLRAYFDLSAPIVSFGYLIGRIGCFFAGCCHGKFCNLPWAVSGRHPTQLYAVIWELGVVLIILSIEKTEKFRAGQLFCTWLVLHGLGRILMETFRDDYRGPSFGWSLSSWISMIFIFYGLYLFRAFRKT